MSSAVRRKPAWPAAVLLDDRFGARRSAGPCVHAGLAPANGQRLVDGAELAVNAFQDVHRPADVGIRNRVADRRAAGQRAGEARRW